MNYKEEHKENEAGFPVMETGFRVPEGYFESFGDRLKQRMEAERILPRRRSIQYYIKPALGLAAGLAVILTVFLYSGPDQQELIMAAVQSGGPVPGDEQTDQLTSTLANQISEVQFFSAITEMDEYDASKMPKEDLADYLASNCNDLEILYASK